MYKKAEEFYAVKRHKLIKKEGKFLIFEYDMDWGTRIEEPKDPLYDNLLVAVISAESLSKLNHGGFNDCWILGNSINQETYIDGYGGDGEINKKAILKNRTDFVNLMKDLFLHLDAPFGWIEYEDYWPDRSSDDVLDGKVPTGNSYVFIGKKYVAKLNKAELKKTDFAKLNNGGILIHNRKLENGRSAFDSTPSTG